MGRKLRVDFSNDQRSGDDDNQVGIIVVRPARQLAYTITDFLLLQHSEWKRRNWLHPFVRHNSSPARG